MQVSEQAADSRPVASDFDVLMVQSMNRTYRDLPVGVTLVAYVTEDAECIEDSVDDLRATLVLRHKQAGLTVVPFQR